MDKEHYIRNIEEKLLKGKKLELDEIRVVISALRKATDCFQEPYYEVIYHDKFGNTETRIMEPVSSRIIEDIGEHYLQEDNFVLHFRRLIKEEAKYE